MEIHTLEDEANAIPTCPALEELETHYRDGITQARTFLQEKPGLWHDEVLNNFPHTLESFPTAWLEQVAHLDDKCLWQLDCGLGIECLRPSELKESLLKLEILQRIPRWPKPLEANYPSWAIFKVSGKKLHEINHIVSVMPALGLKSGETFVDIGGGKGHLPRILCLYHGYHGVTLDTNKHFQELGLARLKKYPAPQGSGELKFVHHTFGPESPQGKLLEDQLFNEAQASLGLHTCGPLSLHHLSKAQKKKALLNFPCCYNKLDPVKHTHISHFLKSNPIPLSKHALTLASRGHTTISFDDYQLKKRVKLMRAAFHFYLQENHNIHQFITVGSAHPRDYRKDFDHYARLKMKQLELKAPTENLNSFFDRHDIQEKVHQVYHANIIRWRWGRLIEKLVVYDRALSLVEKGHPVEVYQFFDEKLSPRNLGLMLRK